ncbi:cell division protein FtsQ/DivIB [Flavobacterium agrisoli]|uniref:Cell division protein FtsQ n=1 Tax=Flavobacterium agrisoli TaxID=2793066 RepID=A0A934UKB3_9FLAO|nr:cell division protein FtsQ [Flavobacterium agrisoli]MBK0370383.1 cell division protein FtsQ [Flavobacterium agrisoli]
MRKINWTTIRLLLMIGLVFFLYSFSSKRNESRKLAKSTVVFVGENSLLITPESVNKLLIENKRELSSIRKDELDLNKIEKALNNQPTIEQSEVFVTIDGVLKAVVTQKTPIARVFNEDRSFYIDSKGIKIPLSANFTARVPLVSGNINTENNQKLACLLSIIHNDSFLKKNIIAVELMPNNSLKMLNRNFDYIIDFGRLVHVERKFDNYKAFFQKAVLDSSLYKYKKIDLRFTEQVVCTK